MKNAKRTAVCLLITLAMILAITPMSIFAEEAGNVVTISSLEELESFRDDVNNGNTYEGYTVSLTESLTLSGEWTPIGNGSRDGKSYTGNAFKGTFDGNANKISGLTVTTTSSSAAVGLFGVVDGGTVKNLVLDVVSINTASKNAGSAIGMMVGGATADGITVASGSVKAPDGVGGVIGRMTVSGTIKNCSNAATVEATASGGAGGIVGKAYYTESDKLMTITDCTNTAKVTSGYAAGGIVALSAADVKGCSNSGAITAATEAGGIVGEQVNRGIVSDNVNTADVIGKATAAGGIVGWVRYQTSASDYQLSELIEIVGNSNSGAISKGDGAGSLGYGGIVGTVYNQVLVKSNKSTAPSVAGGTFAAGILGAAQTESNGNLVLTGETVTTSNNVSTTPLSKITGTCVAADVYNNDNSFVSSDNLTGLSGEGTQASPYLIGTLDELKWFRDSVNAGNTYVGLYINLTADLDLAGEEWTPIGSASAKFQGYFDGGNHTISNLTISEATGYVGLFGYVNGTAMSNTVTPSIQNLKLTSVDISVNDSSSRVGALVGNPFVCYIKNVHVTGTVDGGKWTGGLIGNGYVRIDDCSFEGSVSGSQAGGIAGAGDARVYNCKVIGNVSAYSWAGGIIGNGQEGASAVGCYVKGDVSSEYNWYRGVGGIAGVGGHGYAATRFEDNYFDGNVYLEGEKVPAVVMGLMNANSNADIAGVISGNSWNTEYYPADTVVYVVAEMSSSDAGLDEWVAGAAEEHTSTRNNNLIMLESDIQYVDAENLEDVTIMSFSEVTADDESLNVQIAVNKSDVAFKLEDGILYISYDKKVTWIALGYVNGADGANGKDGKDGVDGVNGTDGADGKDGVDGINGADGKDGVDGINGADGKDGVNGINGADGKDGKDGVDGKDGQDVTALSGSTIIIIVVIVIISAGAVIMSIVAIAEVKRRAPRRWWQIDEKAVRRYCRRAAKNKKKLLK